MEAVFGESSCIDSWMQLVRKVSWNFPGLETEECIIFMENGTKIPMDDVLSIELPTKRIKAGYMINSESIPQIRQ